MEKSIKKSKLETKYLQITAGKGPAECCWVVAQVLKFFLEEIRNNGFNYEVIHKISGEENGTLESATILISGNDLKEFLKTWIGTIQWIGKSEFRKLHKRKNWFVGMYEIEDLVELNINEKDIEYQAVRSQGAGGQNVNKVNSAVRATHIPTQVSVFAQDSRSQHENKKLAKERLLFKLQEFQQIKIQNQINEKWNNHLNLERGNPVKVFSGKDFKKNNETKSFKNKRNELKKELRNELD